MSKTSIDQERFPIGVFDSGFGGLTVLKEFMDILPQYDYIYLGDTARAPYGTRSFESVYQFTLECVKALFDMGCRLVILACNTASAKALRTIQQHDLPKLYPDRRVLGVIRPTTEQAGLLTASGHLGIFATSGTVQSMSYTIEIQKFFPNIRIYQEACPMWVPLIENNEHESPGADYFVKQHIGRLLSKSPSIDAVVLACTHYPLLMRKIRGFMPIHVRIISQGPIVAKSLSDYLKRHPEMENRCSKGRSTLLYTTDDPLLFDQKAQIFFGKKLNSNHLSLKINS